MVTWTTGTPREELLAETLGFLGREELLAETLGFLGSP